MKEIGGRSRSRRELIQSLNSLEANRKNPERIQAKKSNGLGRINTSSDSSREEGARTRRRSKHPAVGEAGSSSAGKLDKQTRLRRCRAWKWTPLEDSHSGQYSIHTSSHRGFEVPMRRRYSSLYRLDATNVKRRKLDLRSFQTQVFHESEAEWISSDVVVHDGASTGIRRLSDSFSAVRDPRRTLATSDDR